MRALVLMAAAGLMTATVAAARAQTTEVDLELCLAVDGSGSITAEEFAFQRRGYAAAIADPDVIDTIRFGPHGRIALAHMEWGGADSMHAIVDWTVIEDEASARAFGSALQAAPRVATGWNSISNAIAFCHAWMDDNDFEGLRRVIDVSGDAGQRGGLPLAQVRAQAVDSGIVINALALDFRGGGLTGPGGIPLLTHFDRHVIGGPGAFAIAVERQEDFVDSLVRKLILEIAGSPAVFERLAARDAGR